MITYYVSCNARIGQALCDNDVGGALKRGSHGLRAWSVTEVGLCCDENASLPGLVCLRIDLLASKASWLCQMGVLETHTMF